MIKGLLVLLAVLCLLMGLLIWAKSRPAPVTAYIPDYATQVWVA